MELKTPLPTWLRDPIRSDFKKDDRWCRKYIKDLRAASERGESWRRPRRLKEIDDKIADFNRRRSHRMAAVAVK